MTDYYAALSEAVGIFQSGDAAGRRAFFNRARRLLIERLQTADPPVPARELRAEVDAFDAAVRQIELELRPPPAPTSRQRPAPPPRQAPPASRPAPSAPSRPPPVAQPRPTPAATQPRPASAAPPSQPAAARPRHPDLAIPPEVVGVTPEEEIVQDQEQEFTTEDATLAPGIEPHVKKRRSPVQIAVLIAVAAILFGGAVAFVFYGGNEVPHRAGR